MLEDRFCIAGHPVTTLRHKAVACVKPGTWNTSSTAGCLSGQYMLSCDDGSNPANLDGCQGGLVEEAWKFLAANGTTRESCQPYQHCPNQQTRNCSLPPGPGPDPNARYSCNVSAPQCTHAGGSCARNRCILDPEGPYFISDGQCINVTGQSQVSVPSILHALGFGLHQQATVPNR